MQKKLTLIFICFALIPLLLVLAWTVAYIQPKQVHNQAEVATRLIKVDIENYLAQRVQDIENFALAQSYLGPEQQSSYTNEFIRTHPEYKLAILVDVHGLVLQVNTQDHNGEPLESKSILGKSFERSSWFQTALESKAGILETPRNLSFIKELYVSQTLKTMPVAKAVRNHEGQITGVWVLFCDIRSFYDLLMTATEDISTPSIFGLYDTVDQPLAEYNKTAGQELTNYDTITVPVTAGSATWMIKSHIQQDSFLDYLSRYFWPLSTALGLMILYAFITARRIAIPLQRLIIEIQKLSEGAKAREIPYQYRQDEYGELARAICQFQITASNSIAPKKSVKKSESATKEIDDAIELVNGLSAQANILALNVSMEAVNQHHLDGVAEQANELAQRTTYNSQELLRKLSEIKSVCEEIKEPKRTKKQA